MLVDESKIRVHPDLEIPVRGETVAASRYEPVDGGDDPLPGLLMYIPYHKDDHITYGAYHPLVTYLCLRGYEVVVADMVGTGASSGRKSEPLQACEGREAATIIDWLADQRWTNGRIGMFGKSYGGRTALAAAAERPDALEAIVPIHAPYTAYRDTVAGDGFALHGMGGHWTPLMQALQAMPPTRRDADGRWADVWAERLDGLDEDDPWLFQFFDHPTRDDYWEGKDADASAIDVPTLAVSGWRDGYPATTLEYAEMVNAETLVLLGPWRHVMPHRGREAAIGFRSQVADWFDAFLKDERTGILDGDRIRFWTERDGGGEVDAGVWRGTTEWPTPETAETLSFALDGGTLRQGDGVTSAFERTYNVDHSVGGHSYDQGKPLDTTPDDVRSVVAETDPFDDAVELTGSGRVTLPISSTLDEPVVAVRLVDVSPDGTATLVTHAERRVELGDDGDDVTVDLKPKSHVFEPGHQLRLAVSGAFFPAVMPPAERGSLTVSSTPERSLEVEFPGTVHRSGVAFDDAITMPDPASEPPAEPDFLDADREWTVTRSAFDDRLTVETSSSHAVEIADARMEYAQRIESTVLPEDPATASVRRTTTVAVEYPAETVTVEASSRVGRDGAQATTRVDRDGQTAFERTWNSNR